MKKTVLRPRDSSRFGTTAGLYWHVHHQLLLEWCYNPRERAEYIERNKPASEQDVRLARLRRVKKVPAFLRKKVKEMSKNQGGNSLAVVPPSFEATGFWTSKAAVQVAFEGVPELPVWPHD